MNRTQLEHIIRAASQISDDTEIVVVGSQAIHALTVKLPPIAFLSAEADVYPRNKPERADDIDAAIGELSQFHSTYGYYAHGVSPNTAILPAGWEQRVIRISNANTAGAHQEMVGCADFALSAAAGEAEHLIRLLPAHRAAVGEARLRGPPMLVVPLEPVPPAPDQAVERKYRAARKRFHSRGRQRLEDHHLVKKAVAAAIIVAGIATGYPFLKEIVYPAIEQTAIGVMAVIDQISVAGDCALIMTDNSCYGRRAP